MSQETTSTGQPQTPNAAAPNQAPSPGPAGRPLPEGEAKTAVAKPPAKPKPTPFNPLPLRVLRVEEGCPGQSADGAPARVFCVVLSMPTEDLSIVANAVDPKTGVRIPSDGERHPTSDAHVARPPWVHCVGLQHKNGPMIASKSPFHNVVVPYVVQPPPAVKAEETAQTPPGAAVPQAAVPQKEA